MQLTEALKPPRRQRARSADRATAITICLPYHLYTELEAASVELETNRNRLVRVLIETALQDLVAQALAEKRRQEGKE